MMFGFIRSGPDDAKGLLFAHDVNEDVPELKGDKVFLWDFIRSVNGGKLPPYNWQLSGSCVNGGAQNALITLQGVEIACLPQPEVFKLPFTLCAYGASRAAIGSTDEGEGSSGDAMAKALASVGTVPLDTVAEQPHICGPALVYDRAVEFKYSSIRNHPAELKEACKKHTLTYGIVKTADEGERELRRGRPLTFAGDWGGLMECEYKGEPRVLMSRHADSWSHQQSVTGFWNHPTLGRIFYVQNQWYNPGPDMEVEWQKMRRGQVVKRIIKAGTAISQHGEPANGEPQGGYWITAKDFEFQASTGEVRSLRLFQGYGDGFLRAGGI